MAVGALLATAGCGSGEEEPRDQFVRESLAVAESYGVEMDETMVLQLGERFCDLLILEGVTASMSRVSEGLEGYGAVGLVGARITSKAVKYLCPEFTDELAAELDRLSGA